MNNMSTFSARGAYSDVKVGRLKTPDCIKKITMDVDPYFSDQAEIAKQNMYGKTYLVSIVYIKMCRLYKGSILYNDTGAVFSYKLRYIVGFWLVEMAISTNQKPVREYGPRVTPK